MRNRASLLITLALSALTLAACGGDDGGGGSATPTSTATRTVTPSPTRTTLPTPTATARGPLDIARCAPDAGAFSAVLDHPFFPLPAGTTWTLEGEDEDGGHVHLEIAALEETEVVAGVTTRVVEERERVDDALSEISRNYFVRGPDGSVCYYGEEVDIYEDGRVVSHEGSWRAGGANRPGIFLPGSPGLGQAFQQESAPGIAEDEVEIVAVGDTVQVPLGTFDDTIEFREFNPLDGDVGTKIFARGAGLIIDGTLARLP